VEFSIGRSLRGKVALKQAKRAHVHFLRLQSKMIQHLLKFFCVFYILDAGKRDMGSVIIFFGKTKGSQSCINALL